MNFSRVAVIGANGFIGRHLATQLLGTPGLRVKLFGRSTQSALGASAPYHQVHLADTAQVRDLFAGIDLVYYLASETIPATSWHDPMIEVQRNLVPFLSFMESAVSVGIRKVVFVSSAGTIYGPTHLSVNERSYTNPFSPYGINKLTMEHYFNYFKVRSGIDYDIYRVSNIYGEGQDTSKGLGIINTFLEKIITERRIQVFGTGEHVRNYIYIGDLINLLSLSISAETGISHVFNASSNDTLSINQLVTIIKEVVSEDFTINYTPTRQSDNPAIYLDNSKILATYPNFRLTPIRDGIMRTYQHLRSVLVTG